MKNLILCAEFLRKNLFSIIIAVLMMLTSTFVLTTLCGRYYLLKYCNDIFLASDLHDDYFSMPADMNASDDMINEIQEMPGVSTVLQLEQSGSAIGDCDINMIYISSEFAEHMSIPVSRGRFINPHSDRAEIVLGGVAAKEGYHIGDTVHLDAGFDAEVVGIIDDITISPHWSRYTNFEFDSSRIFSVMDNVCFISADNTIDKLSDDTYFWVIYDFIVVMEDDATIEERTAVEDYLAERGVYHTIDEITSYSKIYMKDWLRQNLPLPLFIVIIATLNMLSICVITVKRSMSDTSKYYLAGCTSSRIVGIISVLYSVIFSLPMIVNMLLALFNPTAIRWTLYHHIVDYVFNITALIPIVIYTVAIIVVFSVIPSVMYRTYSPIKFYRQNL